MLSSDPVEHSAEILATQYIVSNAGDQGGLGGAILQVNIDKTPLDEATNANLCLSVMRCSISSRSFAPGRR